MRDPGRPVVWDRLSLMVIPGYGSVSKVARSSSTCSLEKLVLFLRLAVREEPLPEATGMASSVQRRESRLFHQIRRDIQPIFLLYYLCSYIKM